MKSYFKLSLLKIRHWPNKDKDKVTVPIFSWNIPIPQLGGDAYSRDLSKLLKKTS
tara:strand:+ start:32728 stop:32892 length:165 start_codon:yes stop_codon:yes gene_type:complete